MLAARRRDNDFLQQLENDTAALTVSSRMGGGGARDAEKGAQFSLASFQALLGMGAGDTGGGDGDGAVAAAAGQRV